MSKKLANKKFCNDASKNYETYNRTNSLTIIPIQTLITPP